MTTPLIVLGASARAASMSARRAGFAPHAADCFADRDLAALCPARRVTDYPAELFSAAQSFPSAPWLYTGGLENYPQLVDQIAAERPLYGNSATVLHRVRDPQQLDRVLRAHNLPAPAIQAQRPVDRESRRWLRKARQGSGGGHVVWTHSVAAEETVEEHDPNLYYFQQYVDGTPAAAVYLADGRNARLVGVSHQLIGQAWTGATGFTYCGSLGPLRLKPNVRRQFEQLGEIVAREFALVGLLGIDVVCTRDGLQVIEINPRYTASVEILERAWNIPSIGWHVACCTGQSEQVWKRVATCCRVQAPLYHGKAILYARSDLRAPDLLAAGSMSSPGGAGGEFLADVPPAGTAIAAGQPIVTVLASARTRRMLLRRLVRRATAIQRLCRPQPVEI